ncbi:MAG: 50S ribosomal protein L18 [Planctomycetota bacterium]
MDKNQKRLFGRQIRHLRVRRKVQGTAERPRLTIFRSLTNVYCQLIDDEAGITLCSASTLSPEIKQKLGDKRGNVKASEAVGETIAKLATAKGIKTICFDRAGYKYHGRVKALADAARKAGLEF